MDLSQRIDEMARAHREAHNDAAARAEQARQRLISLAANAEADTCDPDAIRAAADDLASHVQALQQERAILDELRKAMI